MKYKYVKKSAKSLDEMLLHFRNGTPIWLIEIEENCRDEIIKNLEKLFDDYRIKEKEHADKFYIFAYLKFITNDLNEDYFGGDFYKLALLANKDSRFCLLYEIFSISREVIKSHENFVLYYYPKLGAKKNDPESMFIYANMLINGIGYKKNINKGISLLNKAGKLNHPGAFELLSRIYKEGIIVKENQKKAAFYLSKANECGIGNDFFSIHPNVIKFYESYIDIDQEYKDFYSYIKLINKLKPIKRVYIKTVKDSLRYLKTKDSSTYFIIKKEDKEQFYNELTSRIRTLHNENKLDKEYYDLLFCLFRMCRGTLIKKDKNYMYQVALELEKGNHKYAYASLAYCYYYGLGVEIDYIKSEEYAKKGLEKNPGSSYTLLVNIYSDKKSPLYNKKLAFEAIIKCIESGIIEAITKLMYAYKNGFYVKKDINKVYSLLILGKKLNSVSLIIKYGDYYYQGWDNNEPNYYLALKKYEEANNIVESGECYYKMGLCYLTDQIKNEEKSFEFFLKANELDYEKAKSKLADAYLFGVGTQVNKQKAIEYMHQVNNDKTGNIYNNLGVLYSSGQGGLSQDYEMAFKYYQKAYECKNCFSYSNLAYYYLDGRYVEQDYNKGFELLEEGMKNNAAPAFKDYGRILLEGLYGKEKNEEEGVKLVFKANELDNTVGHELLLFFYRYGVKDIITPDHIKFNFYLNQAIKNHIIVANYYLGIAYFDGYGREQDLEKAKECFRTSIDSNYEVTRSTYFIAMVEFMQAHYYNAVEHCKECMKNNYSKSYLLLAMNLLLDPNMEQFKTVLDLQEIMLKAYELSDEEDRQIIINALKKRVEKKDALAKQILEQIKNENKNLNKSE